MDSATPGLVVMGSIEEAAPLKGLCTSFCLQVHALTPLLLCGYGMICYGFDVLSIAASHSDGLRKHKQNKPCPPQVVYDHGVYHSSEDLTKTHIPCS